MLDEQVCSALDICCGASILNSNASLSPWDVSDRDDNIYKGKSLRRRYVDTNEPNKTSTPAAIWKAESTRQ